MATRNKPARKASFSLQVRLTPVDHGRLVAIAEHLEVTASHVVRMLVRDAFAKLRKQP